MGAGRRRAGPEREREREREREPQPRPLSSRAVGGLCGRAPPLAKGARPANPDRRPAGGGRARPLPKDVAFLPSFFSPPPALSLFFFHCLHGRVGGVAPPLGAGRRAQRLSAPRFLSYFCGEGEKRGTRALFFFFLPLEFLRGNSSLTPPLTFFSVCFCSPRWPGLPPPHHHTPRPLQRGRGAGRMFWCRACARFVCFVFFMRGEVLRMDGWERWAFPARPPVRRPSPPSLDACPTHPLCNTRHLTNPLCA